MSIVFLRATVPSPSPGAKKVTSPLPREATSLTPNNKMTSPSASDQNHRSPTDTQVSKKTQPTDLVHNHLEQPKFSPNSLRSYTSNATPQNPAGEYGQRQPHHHHPSRASVPPQCLNACVSSPLRLHPTHLIVHLLPVALSFHSTCRPVYQMSQPTLG